MKTVNSITICKYKILQKKNKLFLKLTSLQMPSSPAVPRPIVWQLSKTHLDWVWHSDNLHFQQRRQTSREYQSLLMLKSLINARIIQGT